MITPHSYYLTECIREGILADFLLSQRAEVIAVSIFEYNEEMEMKKSAKVSIKAAKKMELPRGSPAELHLVKLRR